MLGKIDFAFSIVWGKIFLLSFAERGAADAAFQFQLVLRTPVLWVLNLQLKTQPSDGGNQLLPGPTRSKTR